MKKLVALLLALSMVFALCGCSSSDYKKAKGLYDEGNYEEAKALFEKLGDYEDSKTYAQSCEIEAKYAIKSTMSEQDFRSNCSEISYEELMRNPNKYAGQYVKIACKVDSSPKENNNEMSVNCATGPSSYLLGYFGDYIHISYRYADENESRMIEDDIIVVYGIFEGSYTYQSMVGQQTVPNITVFYYDYVRHADM